MIILINQCQIKKVIFFFGDKKIVGKVAWDSEAICFMSNISKDVSGGTLFTKIRFEIEDYAKKSNLDTITIDVIMNAKPEISQFYDNPIKDEFESHHGIVKKLEINPKYENYFLTFAYDNTLRIYRDHNRDPLLVLNFDQEITMACWVPINPNLIVVALMDGSLSFYDLSISFEEPQEKIQDQMASNAGAWVVDLIFFEDHEIMISAYNNGNMYIYQINSAYKSSAFLLDQIYCN